MTIERAERLARIKAATDKIVQAKAIAECREEFEIVEAFMNMRTAIRRLENVYEDCLNQKDWTKARALVARVHRISGDRRYADQDYPGEDRRHPPTPPQEKTNDV